MCRRTKDKLEMNDMELGGHRMLAVQPDFN